MAMFRSVNMSFWTDSKVVDDYTPEDKYFMLYVLTNNYTNIIGCYEISIKQISNDLGYTKDVVENLIKRFIDIHRTIDYDFETKELMVLNWYKYNWNVSPKLDLPLLNAIEKVKSDRLYNNLVELYNNRETIEKEIPYRYPIEKKRYPIDTTITNTNTNTISITNTISNNNIYSNIEDNIYSIIIEYLNTKTNSNYKTTTKKTRDLIKARLNEGFTLEDFKIVIDKKTNEWLNNKEMNKFLRPETLFGNKFESYLNQQVVMTTKDLAENGVLDFSKFR